MSREGKLHLVESCSFPRNTYKNVTNEASFKKLKEAAQQIHNRDLKRLSEAKSKDSATVKKILKESKIDEVVQKRVLEALQEAGANIDEVELWQFPVSKINTKQSPNLNGRVYNRELWKNVIELQVEAWKGGTGLANHPADDEDGDFMNQSIVWLDGFLGDDDVVYGIGTFVGAGGALARQIIGVGGRVGFSTSGYGDFLSDGITVDPKSYEIDRLADLVLNPSQGVFGNYADAYSNRKSESVSKKGTNKNLKESKMKKNHLYEDEKIQAITTAIESDDAVTQLCKIADEMGLEVHLQEDGNAEVLTKELSVELIASYVASDAFDAEEGVEDVKECIKAIAESSGEDEAAVKDALKDALSEAGVAEETVDAIMKEKQEEEEEMDEDEDESEETTDEDSDDASEEDDDSDDAEEGDEDMSLEEQLIVEHYSKSLKAIGKKDNVLWEEKIQELETLMAKLKETKLSKAVKTRLNAQSQKLVNSIMKEARIAIQEGFKAKEICEDLGINSIAKLHNIKEKLEDYVSLEECLAKATKEANKYKAIAEAKASYAQSEAEAAFNSEETIKGLQEEVAELKKALAESKEMTKDAKKKGIAVKVESLEVEKELKDLKEEVEVLRKKNTAAHARIVEARKLVAESEKTLAALKKESATKSRVIAENKETIKQLNKRLTEARLQKVALSEAKQTLTAENEKLSKTIEGAKKAGQLAAAQEKRMQEAKARVQKARIDEFFDDNKMFRNSKDIDAFLNESGVKDKSAYKRAKTLREAERQMLFAGADSLLNEAANKSRDNIDVPREDVQSLSDLFND